MSLRTDIERYLEKIGLEASGKPGNRTRVFQNMKEGEDIKIIISSRFRQRPVPALFFCNFCKTNFEDYDYKRTEICPKCGSKKCTPVMFNKNERTQAAEEYNKKQKT